VPGDKGAAKDRKENNEAVWKRVRIVQIHSNHKEAQRESRITKKVIRVKILKLKAQAWECENAGSEVRMEFAKIGWKLNERMMGCWRGG
jgi:ribosomal protein S6